MNRDGKGPAWHNSLFEDNAEFGYGMALAQGTMRARLKGLVGRVQSLTADDKLAAACDNYIKTFDDSRTNSVATKSLTTALEKHTDDEKIATLASEILKNKDFLNKKSVWIFGGDGWAYDIGFGGLDHVLASGENVNILVFDTEVYSNTGGQASKATPTGSVAQFAASGKAAKKKDLASIAMSYGDVYVAQVAMGADYNQCVKAFVEAESYHGPSIIIAYAPCINHGIKTGMSTAQLEQKKAIQSGYWHLFRFDPRLKNEAKNPFMLDSKAPTLDYSDFLMNEVRYSSLAKAAPERAEGLFKEASEQAKNKYDALLRLSQDWK